MNFQLTSGQERAVKASKMWWKLNGQGLGSQQVFKIFGYAGCLDENTLILTDKGTITLKDLILLQRKDLNFKGFEEFQNNIKVYNGWEYTDISHIYATDIMDGYLIKTKSGLEIKCSNIHPFLTLDGKNENYKWVKSSELQKGNMIATLGNKCIHNLEELKIEYNDFYFLGYYLADGYYYKNRLMFTSKKRERLDELNKYLNKRFDICGKITYRNDKNTFSIDIRVNEQLKNLLRQIGLDVKHKYINLDILDTPNKKFNFLYGLMNDFTISNNDIEFSNLHKENIQKFIILMREFGIIFLGCKEKFNKSGTTFKTNLLKESSINLLKIFGDITSSKKENSLSNFVTNFLNTKNNTNINLYNNLEDVCKNIKNIKDIVGTVGYDYRSGRRKISRDKLKILSEKTQNKFLNKIYNDGFFFDEIVEILPIKQKFYDLTVPNNNSFVSNSIISHNTGKSTIVNLFIESMGLNSTTDVRFITYTGKAALVLHSKGLRATTIHKLIYEAVEKQVEKELPDGTKKIVTVTKFVKRPFLPPEIKLLVVDECSMVSENIWNDLLSFNVPMIVLGDTGQLPPIQGQNPFMFDPDVMLTEVMRQAADNPIIYLSMLAREGKKIDYGNYGGLVDVINQDIIPDNILTSSDIIITTTNQLRDDLNNYMRYNILGRKTQTPEINDKLICRKNNWEKSVNNIPLINGLIGTCINQIDLSEANKGVFKMDFQPEIMKKSYFEGIECNLDIFSGLSAKERQEIQKDRFAPGEIFEYGYAITTHLSQGSSWNNPFVFYSPYGTFDFRKKLLYTAITRAETRLTLSL